MVTFNWPADTVRRFFVKEAGVVKPIDKKSNYVKRCVAIPGDKLILNSKVITNKKGIWKFDCSATVENELVAKAMILCADRPK